MRIKKGIADNVGVCLRSSVGVAPNRFLAKVASDMEKPNGLTILQASDLPDHLFELDLRDLPGIGRNMYRRLLLAGVPDIKTFIGLPPKLARRIWGSIEGERMWWQLQGLDLAEQATERRSVGHSHVLAPELRNEIGAHRIARRLLIKAGSRLRRLGYRTRCLALTVWLESRWEWSGAERLIVTQDSFTLLEALERLWRGMLIHAQRLNFEPRIKQISVALLDLAPLEEDQFELFGADGTPTDATVNARRLRLSRALDRVNGKLGRDTVKLGIGEDRRPDTFTGTKIAFTRIPALEEFNE